MPPASSPPTITIVIPTYNAASYLSQTLDSVRNQTFNDWQCIIVDDGSSDDTLSISQNYATQDARFTVMQQPNAGGAAARNRGFENTNPHCPYVVFLDHDDIYQPQALQFLFDSIENNPNAPAVYASGSFIDQHGNPTRPGEFENYSRSRLKFLDGKLISSDKNEPTSFNHLAVACAIYTCGIVLMRTQSLRKVGAFDDSIYLADDWDLWIRLSRLGDIPFTDHPIIQYRKHDSNASSNKLVSLYNVAIVRQKTMISPHNTPEQQYIARKAYRRFYMFMAKARLHSPSHALTGLFNRKKRTSVILGWINLVMSLAGRRGNSFFILIYKNKIAQNLLKKIT